MIAEDRIDKVILTVIATLDDLKKLGMVEGGCYTCSDEGRKLVEQWKSEGFAPTKEEVDEAMMILQMEARRQEEEYEQSEKRKLN